jgi:hypothetical protein
MQRCTVHKHRNLLAHAPERLHEEIPLQRHDLRQHAEGDRSAPQVVHPQVATEVPCRCRQSSRCRQFGGSGDRLFTFTRLAHGRSRFGQRPRWGQAGQPAPICRLAWPRRVRRRKLFSKAADCRAPRATARRMRHPHIRAAARCRSPPPSATEFPGAGSSWQEATGGWPPR